MGIKERLERLKYTRVKGGSEVAAGARTIGKKVSGGVKATQRGIEEIRVRQQQKRLEGYQREQHRRDLAETRVYGRTLTEKERGQFQRVQKEKRERKRQQLARLAGAPPRRYAPRRRSGRVKVVYVQPQPRIINLDPSGLIIGGGQPMMGNGRRTRKKDSLNLGGLLY